MMNRNKVKMMIISLIAMLSVAVFAADSVQSIYNAADGAPAIRIKYNGSATTCTISNGAGVVSIVDGTTSNIIVTPTTTFTTLLGNIAAVTNGSGEQNFQAELVNAIGADLASNVVSAANISLVDGKWHEILKFDTSACLFYSSASYGYGMGQRVLKNVFGNILGTGDVTLGVYVDGTLKYSKALQSPIYSTVDGTVVNTNAYISAEIDLGTGIVVGGDQKVSVRATRATTATTGGIGASFEARK